MASPFLSLDKLDDATRLVNLFSNVIGKKVSSINFASSTYNSPTKHDTQFTIEHGGTLNDYALDFNGSTNWNDTSSSWAGTYGDKGSIDYDPIDVTVTGLGSIVEGGLIQSHPNQLILPRIPLKLSLSPCQAVEM